jgi:predicted HTH transcriptional regulator
MEIDSAEIRTLGETQTVEFKKSLSLQREALEALCGMINSDSATGKVLFGVSPDGTINGVEEGNLDSAQKKLAQHVRQKFDPPIVCNIHILQCEGRTLLLVQADRAVGVPYHEYDGRAYIREGSTRRLLSYDEKRQLLKKRERDQHNGPWQCDRCGAIVGTLSSIAITDQGVKKTYSCTCGGEFWPIT